MKNVMSKNKLKTSYEIARDEDESWEKQFDNLRKEQEKDILIHGIFMGVLIGSLLTGIMIDVLQKLEA